MVALRHHKSTAIVEHQPMDRTVDRLHGDLDAGCRRVLLDVGEGFRDLPEDHGFELVRQLVRELELELCLDPRDRAKHCHAVAERLVEAAGQLERRWANLEKQPAEGVFGLSQQRLDLAQSLRDLAVRVEQSLESKLRRRELLKRVVVEIARESPARLVNRGRNVFEEKLSSGIHLLQPCDSLLELTFSMLQLPDEAGREP